MDDTVRTAEALLAEFASRTGLSVPGASRARYLWTDAFAVFGFLALHELTEQDVHLTRALRLVDLVHHVLGRHRADDVRTGWISGLDEAEGERHPTRGGLRIGKRRAERRPAEPFDAEREWDRDGQYFHYLTKWMHALDRTTLVTGDATYHGWAVELAEVAHRAFLHHAPDGRPRLCWKMSIDLSRPLVPSAGQLDALDALVTCRRLLATRVPAAPPPAGLAAAPAVLLRMCADGAWATTDPLGIGELLADAGFLVRLVETGAMPHVTVLDDVLRDADRSLRAFAARPELDRPAGTRLAFRELGLAIGLRALPSMRERVRRSPARFRDAAALLARIDAIARHAPLVDRIAGFWLDPANRRADTWTGHLDINAVMLATSLVPHVYLLDDRPTASSGPARPPSLHGREHR